MKTKMNSRQSGFTLVELIVVIIILAILGAVALPKFIDVTEKAQVSAVKGAAGGLGAGVALYHAQWVANGLTAATTDLVGFGGTGVTSPLDSNGAGWPIDENSSMSGDADCVEIWTGLMQNPPTVGTDATAATIDYEAGHDGTTGCEYTYYGGTTTDTLMGITYETSTGVVTVDADPNS